MAVTAYTAIALAHLGWELDHDYHVFEASGTLRIEWLSEQLQPSDAEIQAAEVPALKAITINAIKGEASRRILAIVPSWKQSNLQARFAELTAQRIDQYPVPLSSGDQAEYDAIKAAGLHLLSIRTASNAMEAELGALKSVAEVEDYAAGLADNLASAPRTVEWP